MEWRVVITPMFADGKAIENGNVLREWYTGEMCTTEGDEVLCTDSLEDARKCYDDIVSAWRGRESWHGYEPCKLHYNPDGYAGGGADYHEVTLSAHDIEWDEVTVLDSANSYPENICKLYEAHKAQVIDEWLAEQDEEEL